MATFRWKIEKIPLDSMSPAYYNARVISDDNYNRLEACLKHFGYVELIVWNEITGNIVGGHQRYEILKSDGATEAMVIVVQMKESVEKSANLTLNNPEIEGEFDEPINELLDEIEKSQSDLFDLLGFEDLRESLVDNERGGGGANDESKGDTVCPCCSHTWNVEGCDVTTETVNK